MDYKTDMKRPKKKTQEEEDALRVKRVKVPFVAPFFPAALKKCEPFMKDQEIYQEDKNRLKSFYSESKIV
jgi:hypothetical protein